MATGTLDIGYQGDQAGPAFTAKGLVGFGHVLAAVRTVGSFCGHNFLRAFDLAEHEVPPVFLRSASRVRPLKLIGKQTGGGIPGPVRPIGIVILWHYLADSR